MKNPQNVCNSVICTVNWYLYFRQTVRDLTEAIQPGRAAALRKNALKRRLYAVKGPNHIWHVDGNDKLLPFGFGIHGAIDGYSRKLIWLELLPSNKNPSQVVKLYLKAVQELKLIPQVLRADKGTENFTMGDYQTLLSESPDNDNSTSNFVGTLYGSSNHNQRIEQFWGYLKKVLLLSYSSIFKDMQDCGLLTKNTVERRCLYFCFERVLKKDLEEVKQRWNSHRVRRNLASDLPAGVPNFLYSMPQYYSNEERGRKFKNNVLEHLIDINSKETLTDVDYLDFEEWALEVMLFNGWTAATDKDTAIDLYGKLLSKLRQ